MNTLFTQDNAQGFITIANKGDGSYSVIIKRNNQAYHSYVDLSQEDLLAMGAAIVAIAPKAKTKANEPAAAS